MCLSMLSRRPSLQTRFVSLGSNPFCISAGFLHSRTALLFFLLVSIIAPFYQSVNLCYNNPSTCSTSCSSTCFLTCLYCSTSCSICQPSAFNNPTTHRTIATPLIIICGLFITRYDHVKKHRAPTSATALRKLS
jgi:hypothetical protein